MTQLLGININNSELENYKAINHVVDMVEWDEVHKVMECLDWKWGLDKPNVPEVCELKEFALELAEKAVSGTIKGKIDYSTACGGIECDTKFYPDTGCVYLRVNFVLTGWDNLL